MSQLNPSSRKTCLLSEFAGIPLSDISFRIGGGERASNAWRSSRIHEAPSQGMQRCILGELFTLRFLSHLRRLRERKAKKKKAREFVLRDGRAQLLRAYAGDVTTPVPVGSDKNAFTCCPRLALAGRKVRHHETRALSAGLFAFARPFTFFLFFP